MNMRRCNWATHSELEKEYHDTEWGIPVYADDKWLECLILEGAQAGLSWYTVLKKRENYREAYQNFNPTIVASFDQEKEKELIQNTGLIRNKSKIKSSITNAKALLRVAADFGSFSNYMWGFVNHKPIINHWENVAQVPLETELSKKISKDLQKRGFKFVGSKICYALMQATGLVNDHSTDCFLYQKS